MINYLKIHLARSLVFLCMFVGMGFVALSVLVIIYLSTMMSNWYLLLLLLFPFELSLFTDIMGKLCDWEFEYERFLKYGR